MIMSGLFGLLFCFAKPGVSWKGLELDKSHHDWAWCYFLGKSFYGIGIGIGNWHWWRSVGVGVFMRHVVSTCTATLYRLRTGTGTGNLCVLAMWSISLVS
jgi:hypothetical protein